MFKYLTFINLDIFDNKFDDNEIKKHLYDVLKDYGNVNQIFIKPQSYQRKTILLDMELKENYYNDLINKRQRYGDKAFINTVISLPLKQNFRLHFNLENRQNIQIDSQIGEKRERHNFIPVNSQPARPKTPLEIFLQTIERSTPFELNLPTIDGSEINIYSQQYPVYGLVSRNNEFNVVSFSCSIEVQNFLEVFTEYCIKIIPPIVSFSQFIKKKCVP